MTAHELAEKHRLEKNHDDPKHRSIHSCKVFLFRKSMGLTVKLVAPLLDLSESRIHAIESGQEVTLSTMKKWAKFYGKRIDELWDLD